MLFWKDRFQCTPFRITFIVCSFLLVFFLNAAVAQDQVSSETDTIKHPLIELRDARIQARQEFLTQAEDCLSNLDEVFEIVSGHNAIDDHGELICEDLREGWYFRLMKNTSGSNTGSNVRLEIDDLFNIRNIIGIYGAFENNIETRLQFVLTPDIGNTWKVNAHGTPFDIYVEDARVQLAHDGDFYIWARDMSDHSFKRPFVSDVDGNQDVQYIECQKGPGNNGVCYARYLASHCKNQLIIETDLGWKDTDFYLGVGVLDWKYKDDFLQNYEWVHSVSERILQGFMEHTCRWDNVNQ